MKTHQTKKNWENSSLANMPHSDLPSSSVTCQQDKIRRFNQNYKRITIDELASQLDVNYGSAHTIIESLR